MIKLAERHGIQKVLADVEIEILKSVLHLSNSQAAKKLRIPITTYRSKVQKYKLK